MDSREIRGYSILAKGDEPLIINSEEFLVPSQSSKEKYKVSKLDGWTCECKDFKFRKTKCKHIHAVEFLLKMRGKVDNDEKLEFVDEIAGKVECQFCKSDNIVRNGFVKNKGENKQRFFCKSCKKTFYKDAELNYIRNPKVIVLAIDLYMKGLSLRKITDTLNQFFSVKIHHETVRRWITKFTASMNNYVNQFKPELSEAWHLDEQNIKVKGKWLWSWNCLDEGTRFLIANTITEKRNVNDARQILQNAVSNVEDAPEFLITDGLHAYKKAIKKEFCSVSREEIAVKHVRARSLRDKRQNNNIIERFHSTFRERDKVMRGFKSKVTAKEITDGFRTYYNFIRPHQALNGLTPSQTANIQLNLDRNKWLSLLKQSLKR